MGGGLGQARHGFDKNMPAGHQGHDKRFAWVSTTSVWANLARMASAGCKCAFGVIGAAEPYAGRGNGATGRAAVVGEGMFGCSENKVLAPTVTLTMTGGLPPQKESNHGRHPW